MPLNSKTFIGSTFILSTLLACSPSHDNSGAAVSVLPNVQPHQLLLGKKVNGSAERCIYAVQVDDAKQACLQNECGVQAFYWPAKAVSDRQRALLVSECSTNHQLKNGQLLTNQGPTGDSGILIFQPRREGEGLWQNIELSNGDYGVQMATEAAEGVLSYQQGNYTWEENPN